jgi:hypothetical protein
MGVPSECYQLTTLVLLISTRPFVSPTVLSNVMPCRVGYQGRQPVLPGQVSRDTVNEIIMLIHWKPGCE